MDKFNSPDFKKLQEQMEIAREEWKSTIDSKWYEIDYDTRMIAAEFIFKKLVEHAEDGCSYRGLIYDKLGFDTDAYCQLLDYGMTISNEFMICNVLEPKEIEIFGKIVDKIPAYLTEEDAKNYNFNEDRGPAYNMYFKLLDMNKELALQKKKYNKLMNEYYDLLDEYEELMDEINP